MTKAQTTLIEQGLPTSIKATFKTNDSHSLLHSHLEKVTQKFLKVLSNKNESKYLVEIEEAVKRQGKQKEIDTLEQLELCINAARKTEGFEQYD